MGVYRALVALWLEADNRAGKMEVEMLKFIFSFIFYPAKKKPHKFYIVREQTEP